MSVVTAVEYRAKAAAAMSEAQLQEAVIALAKALGWRHFDTHDSRRSPAGFPDLVMVRRGRLLFVELKAQRGRYGPGQVEWLQDLAAVADRAYLAEGDAYGFPAAGDTAFLSVHTWRPCDLLDGTIEAVLRSPG